MTEDHDHYNEETLIDELFEDKLLGVSLIPDNKDLHLYPKHALLVPIDATHSSPSNLKKPPFLSKSK